GLGPRVRARVVVVPVLGRVRVAVGASAEGRREAQEDGPEGPEGVSDRQASCVHGPALPRGRGAAREKSLRGALRWGGLPGGWKSVAVGAVGWRVDPTDVLISGESSPGAPGDPGGFSTRGACPQPASPA